MCLLSHGHLNALIWILCKLYLCEEISVIVLSVLLHKDKCYVKDSMLVHLVSDSSALGSITQPPKLVQTRSLRVKEIIRKSLEV